MRLRGARARMSVLLLVVLTAAACTNGTQPGEPEETEQPSGESAAGLPTVTPQPVEMERLGDDIKVHGKVALIIDSLVGDATRDLAARTLKQAGADEVVIRKPGPRIDDVTLRVRIGDNRSPTMMKELQALRYDAASPLEPEGYILAGHGGSDTLMIGAADPEGVYYGVQTLRQLVTPGRIAGVGIIDYPALPIRGTIEGFYGSPWTHEERMNQLAFYGEVKLNSYVYAPKDDPYHRERWREPYPEDKLAQVEELIDQALSHYVKFTFALSPGTSICYSDPADRAALMAKLQAMYDSGVRDFSVPLDDISYTQWNCPQDEAVFGPPSQASAGRAQADLLNDVQQNFVPEHPGTRELQTVLTEYSDVENSPYKTALREELDPEVQVMWTGDGVIPEEITVGDAQLAAEIWGRPVMLWDNYPVNDFNGAAGRLMLGPYAKREVGLGEYLTGIAINPMNQAAASKVVEFGAADFAWNDAVFDPRRAQRAAAEYLARDPAAVDPLLLFFDLQEAAPLSSGEPWLPPAPQLTSRLDEFRATYNSGDHAKAVAGLRGYARQLADAPEQIRSGVARNFVADSGPWLDAADLWGEALLATVDGLEARANGADGRADQRFAEAAKFAAEAEGVQTIPGENRNQSQALVADGVLDTFIRQAPRL